MIHDIIERQYASNDIRLILLYRISSRLIVVNFIKPIRMRCRNPFKKLVVIIFVAFSLGGNLLGQVDAGKSLSNQSIFFYDDFEGAIGNSSYDAILEELASSVDSMFGMKTLYDFLYFPVTSGIGPDEVSNLAEENRVRKIQTNNELQNGSISLVFSFGSGEVVQDGVLYDFTEWPTGNELSDHERSMITLRAKAAAEQYLDIHSSGFKGAAVAYLRSLLSTPPEENACFCYMGEKYLSEDTIYIPKGQYEFEVSIIPNTYPSDSCKLDKFSDLTLITLFSKKSFSNRSDVLRPDKRASKEVGGHIIEASMTYNEEMFFAVTRVVVVEIEFGDDLVKRDENLRLTGDWNDKRVYQQHGSIRVRQSVDIIPNIKSYYQYYSDSYGLPYRMKVTVTPRGVDRNRIKIASDARDGGGVISAYVEGNRKDSLELPILPVASADPWGTDTLKVGKTNYRLIKRYNRPLIRVPLTLVVVTTKVKEGTSDVFYSPKKTTNEVIQSRIREVNKFYRRVGVMFDVIRIVKDTVENVTKTFEYTKDEKLQLTSLVDNSDRAKAAISNRNAVIMVVNKIRRTSNSSGSFSAGTSFNGNLVVIVPDIAPALGSPIKAYGHELGHAVFGLLHPFDEFAPPLSNPVFNEGDDDFNIMDYAKPGVDEEINGTQHYFYPYQFSYFRKPNYVEYNIINYK